MLEGLINNTPFRRINIDLDFEENIRLNEGYKLLQFGVKIVNIDGSPKRVKFYATYDEFYPALNEDYKSIFHQWDDSRFNHYMTKPHLQQKCDLNGIKWYKSWNRKRLVQALMKVGGKDNHITRIK